MNWVGRVGWPLCPVMYVPESEAGFYDILLLHRRWSSIQLKHVQRYHGARSSLLEPQTIGGARAEVQYVGADEAKQMVTEQGYSIIDIRDQAQYERSHIPSSVHVPLFLDNKDMDPGMFIFPHVIVKIWSSL